MRKSCHAIEEYFIGLQNNIILLENNMTHPYYTLHLHCLRYLLHLAFINSTLDIETRAHANVPRDGNLYLRLQEKPVKHGVLEQSSDKMCELWHRHSTCTMEHILSLKIIL